MNTKGANYGRVTSLRLMNLSFATRLHSCYLLQEGSQYEKEGAHYEEYARYNEARHETRQER